MGKKYPKVLLSKFQIERKIIDPKPDHFVMSKITAELTFLYHKTKVIDLSDHDDFLIDLKAFLEERNAILG